MSSMDKMWASLTAIGLMALSSLVITFARYKLKKGIWRLLLSIIAFILLFYGFLLMIISIL